MTQPSAHPRLARRLGYHLRLAAVSLPLGLVVAWLRPRADLREQWSIATAYVGLLWIAVSLVLGPLNLIRCRPNPVSSDLRRDVGIWGGVAGLVHMAVGLTVHMRGRMSEYFFTPADVGGFPIRLDPFGLANHTGLASSVILAALLMLSSDWSLRALGAPRWKRWQQSSYLCAAALVVHGALYQLAEKRRPFLVMTFALVILATVVVQLAGIRVRRAAVAARAGGGQSLGAADQL